MYQPVVIIGAPRSGTNMLRDMLAALPGVGTWPCDEINYIWRHRNVRYGSDEFSPEMATPAVQTYINRQFDKFAEASHSEVVIEKTCANSLRVGFVHRVVPRARYIFIVRDGLDAVGSAMERWTASFDAAYVLKKARYVPPADLGYYAARYLLNHVRRLRSRERRLAFWGPAMNNMDALVKKHTLSEVCALQWQACVDKAERDFSEIDPVKIHRVRYEDFVGTPVSEFAKVAGFIGRTVPDAVNEYLQQNVSAASVGKGRKALGPEQAAALTPLIGETLKRCGYE